MGDKLQREDAQGDKRQIYIYYTTYGVVVHAFDK
jgi:hypothetical protein